MTATKSTKTGKNLKGEGGIFWLARIYTPGLRSDGTSPKYHLFKTVNCLNFISYITAEQQLYIYFVLSNSHHSNNNKIFLAGYKCKDFLLF